nr:YtxH domain-containing protein [uncultured Lachnoanaerobaculum sp.]
MGFFDQLGDVAKNIGKSAGDFAKQVGDKTNDALEISKLNTKISAENAEIEKEKKKLSDALYERFAKGEEVPDEVKEFCDNIKSHLLNIDGFKEEIEKVKAAAAERATNLKEDIHDKVDDLKDAVSDVKDHAEDFAEDVKDAADNVVDEVKDHVEDAKDAVHDAVDNIKEDNN